MQFLYPGQSHFETYQMSTTIQLKVLQVSEITGCCWQSPLSVSTVKDPIQKVMETLILTLQVPLHTSHILSTYQFSEIPRDLETSFSTVCQWTNSLPPSHFNYYYWMLLLLWMTCTGLCCIFIEDLFQTCLSNYCTWQHVLCMQSQWQDGEGLDVTPYKVKLLPAM